jgi:acyl-CoA synthetase (NDP forming)
MLPPPIFFAAGFLETRTDEGEELERQLTKRVEDANFHLIGPYCMGIFNPKLGIKQTSDQYSGASGPVGFIAQSGAIAVTFSLEAHLQGLDINKSVSSGNGIVLDATDFLEYFGDDPEVKAIGMYLEGVNNGRKFFETLRRVAKRKPVVIWKGGRSEDGSRAIASHTGALSISRTVSDTILKQCGALAVTSTETLIDTLKALIYLPPVLGNRVAVTGGSGGQSVAITDALADVGFNVPPLTQESYNELATFFNVVGGSYRNPIDTAGPVRRDMKRILEIVERDANIDNLVLVCSTKPGRQMMPAQLQNSLDLAQHIKDRTVKPVLVFIFLYTPDASREKREIIFRYQEIGIPAFPSIERGVLALKNALSYYGFHTIT